MAGRIAGPGPSPADGRRPRSPLHDILAGRPDAKGRGEAPNGAPFAMAERPFLGKLLLIGGDAPFQSAASGILGFDLPVKPNSCASEGDLTALWLSPSEWMLVTPESQEPSLAESLRRGLAGIHAAVVDVSDRWTVISIGGSQATSVLSKGTAVDLTPPAFGVGRCCQTRLFSTAVIIQQVSDAPTFDVFVDGTFAEYLWLWFETASDHAKGLPAGPGDGSR